MGDPNTDQPADEPAREKPPLPDAVWCSQHERWATPREWCWNHFIGEMTPPPHEWPRTQAEIDQDAADEVPTR